MGALSLTYDTALAEVKSRIGTVNLSDAQIGRRLNWAVQELAGIFRIETLLFLTNVTTDADGKANLVHDADILSATWRDTGYKLEPVTLSQYAGWNSAEITGDPRHFIRLNNFTVSPVTAYIQILPAAAGTVDLVLRVAPYEWTTGECPLPSRFFRAIVAGASYFCLSDLNEDEPAGIAKKQYDQAVTVLRDREAEEFIHSNQGVAFIR